MYYICKHKYVTLIHAKLYIINLYETKIDYNKTLVKYKHRCRCVTYM